MDAVRLNQQIGDLAATLGDATRRGIYITVVLFEIPIWMCAHWGLLNVSDNAAGR